MKPAPSRLEALPLDGGQAEVLLAREPDARFAVHWHAEWSVGAIETGHCDFSCAGLRHHATAGNIVVMAPGTIHTAGVSVQGFAMRMLYLPSDWVHAAMAWPSDRRPAGVRTALQEPALAMALCDAVDRRDAVALRPLVVQALELACTGPLTASDDDDAGVPAPRDPRVQRLCDELAQLDTTSLDLATLAQRIGVSREHLHRLFRDTVGLSPREYSRCARIHQAKRMLQRAEPIAETAQACGFADQAHFSRWFKRVFGVTPAAYRPHG